MAFAFRFRKIVGSSVLLSGLLLSAGCTTTRSESFANALQVTPGELSTVSSTAPSSLSATEKNTVLPAVNRDQRPSVSPGTTNAPLQYTSPVINLPTAPAPEYRRSEKPAVDLSWIDQPAEEYGDEAVFVTAGYGPVTAGYGPSDDPSLNGYASFTTNESSSSPLPFNAYAPNDGVVPIAYDQPSAYFSGGIMGLETPGVEPMPPLYPNGPPGMGLEQPSVVLKRPRLHERIWGEIVGDYSNFYSWQSLTVLGVGFGIGGAVANTSLDQRLRDSYQNRFGNSPKNTLHKFKFLGEGAYMIPLWAAATLTEVFFPDSMLGDTVGLWGERALRAAIVGVPPLLLMQMATGGSRPGEVASGSHWHFFKDNNGVSGHAFIGAVSFITAAKMTDDPFLKTGFYAGSVLAGLSRINDDAHYPSQVALGWFLAYMACTAVDLTDFQSEHIAIVPLTAENTSGIGIEFRR